MVVQLYPSALTRRCLCIPMHCLAASFGVTSRKLRRCPTLRAPVFRQFGGHQLL